jgi:shikimate dehydrogenase
MPSSAEPVHTLADLVRWPHAGTSIAVLGHPIAHSLSPLMHNAALAALARDHARFRDWRYVRFDVPPADLPQALDLLHAKKFHGLNLTVPHKILAFERVAQIDPAALRVGAVNTLVWTERGWRGHNTDGYGLATAVRETLGRNLAGTHIVLLGAGGAARGAAVECLQQRCASLWIGNRTRTNLDALLAVLAPLAGKISLRDFLSATPSAAIPGGALVINATSAGLHASDAPPVDLRKLPRPASVYEMIYNPPETPLLTQARALGLPRANGLAMLVHQGAKSLEIWTGVPAVQTAPIMRAAALAATRG